MKKSDKFLIGIVIGIVVLVIVVLGVALFQPKPAYMAEDTPEGVVNNYLLALQQEDYTRAYSYLSPAITDYPGSANVFKDDVLQNSWSFGQYYDDVTLSIESANTQVNFSTVKVQENSFKGYGLLGSNYSDTFDIRLRRDTPNSPWKITGADKYWALCWENGNCNR